MKARSKKAKGTRLEKWLADKFKSIGLESEKQPGSGAFHGHPKDVWVIINDDKWIAECKARANGEGFKTLDGWLEGADILVLRADRSEPRVYLRWEMFARLVGKPPSE